MLIQSPTTEAANNKLRRKTPRSLLRGVYGFTTTQTAGELFFSSCLFFYYFFIICWPSWTLSSVQQALLPFFNFQFFIIQRFFHLNLPNPSGFSHTQVPFGCKTRMFRFGHRWCKGEGQIPEREFVQLTSFLYGKAVFRGLYKKKRGSFLRTGNCQPGGVAREGGASRTRTGEVRAAAQHTLPYNIIIIFVL